MGLRGYDVHTGNIVYGDRYSPRHAHGVTGNGLRKYGEPEGVLRRGGCAARLDEPAKRTCTRVRHACIGLQKDRQEVGGKCWL